MNVFWWFSNKKNFEFSLFLFLTSKNCTFVFFFLLFFFLLFFFLTHVFFSFCEGHPTIVNRTNKVEGSVVEVAWNPCAASLFTIYYKEDLSDNWKKVNVSGQEIRHHVNLSCGKKYEIAMTAWRSTAETPLKAALNSGRLWRVTTLGGNNYNRTFTRGRITLETSVKIRTFLFILFIIDMFQYSEYVLILSRLCKNLL